MQESFILNLLKEISPSFNVEVHNFKDNIHGGYLSLPNGKRHYFKSSRWDVNTLGGSRVVTDKTLTLRILEENKFNIPKGILLKEFDIDIFRKFKFPIVVKPNSEHKARGLSYVEKIEDAEKAFLFAKSFENIIRVEEVVTGKHMSLGIFNGKVYFAYEKEAFSAGNIIKDYTNSLDENFISYIGKIPNIFNLKLASIDCIYNGEMDIFNPNELVIIEVNSAPSFRKYGEFGENARENVKLLYTDLIRFILN